MRHNLVISDEAEGDIEQAYLWYEQQQNGLGDEFLLEVEKCFTDISSASLSFGFRKKNIRGCLVGRFPYIIFFFVEDRYVKVISVFHCHRKPFL
jgi:plasmid stabilization system protein ParE